MAKPNYAFAKRQRELAKKQKKEEKLKRKAEQGGSAEGGLQQPEEQAGEAADREPEGEQPR
ncbi:MAG: hypothetical protein KJ011_14915 [Burkholderiaceae bacterium]|nr:hypothetical protein [Burkholderiaceae bacterium]